MSLDACPECGARLRADGLCAKCMIGLGVEPEQSTLVAESPPSRQIGRYKILETLGEGGMGVVYLAEQTEPVRRKVALKVIKHGMDTHRHVVARFDAERQALAMMDHPSIARVYDAGATRDGRPYFVMEHVQGVPINEHCDRQRLDTRQRLELFVQVCRGVQHAHQKAVIHRDLKPSNVLVTIQDGRTVPKIIDFGIAKAMAQPLTQQTLHTELGQLIGTPEYMSPEQVEMTGQDIDTRTDVYALGVMLYVLLVGELPFGSEELRGASFDEMRRKIREDEPPRPSVRLASPGTDSDLSARNRRTEPRALERRLRGDLDWITMRALEKDRTRRYGSPDELAADVERHLRHEPVLAGPPGVAYRLGKFVRRHRTGVAVGVAAGLLLVAAAAASPGWLRARSALRQQRVEASLAAGEFAASVRDYAGALEHFGTALGWNRRSFEARMGRAMARLELARESGSAEPAQRALEDLSLAAALQPDLQSVRKLRAELLRLVGQSARAEEEDRIAASLPPRAALDFRFLGDLAKGERDYPTAIAHYDAAIGLDPQMFEAIFQRGVCRQRLEQFSAARVDFEIVTHLVPEYALPHNNLASLLELEEDFQAAAAGFERAIGIDAGNAAFHSNLGLVLMKSGDLERAESSFRRALELSPSLSTARNNLGWLLMNTDREDEALPHFLEAIRIEESHRPGELDGAERLLLQFGEPSQIAEARHEQLITGYVNVCNVHLSRRDASQAKTACERAASIAPEDKDNHYNLASLRMLEGNVAGALASLERDVELGDTDFNYLLEDELFTPLHDDARLRALLARMREASRRLASTPDRPGT